MTQQGLGNLAVIGLLIFLQDEEGSTDKQKLNLTDKAEWQYSDREKENLEVFYTRTARGNRIACMFVKCAPNARFTILHSHGNAVDLGQMSSFYLGLGSRYPHPHDSSS